ncbi:MAG: hypothetical protein C5B50_08220 [Verrucomicrobia bacterium]|nr:MAG: hypothetical protein C5B50_08220 [Verrucomicrobiota bacterium]
MQEFVSFGSRVYVLLVLLLISARGMDILSTWVATPNLILEGNPIAKRLGWKWGIPINLALCFGLAYWPLPAIVISTTSVLVAARNFQSAWLMRSLGEHLYREWHVERVQQTSITLYLFCLFGQTVLTGVVGVAVLYFSDGERGTVLTAIGMGIVAYAVAVAFFTLIGILRLRRANLREVRLAQQNVTENALLAEKKAGMTELYPSDGLPASGK